MGIFAAALALLATASASPIQTQAAHPDQPAIVTLAHTGEPEPAAAKLAARAPALAAEAENYRAFGKIRVNDSSQPEVFTLNFHQATTVTGIQATADFHVSGGTCTAGHAYLANDSCSVEVVFAPQGPGHRTGKLVVSHSASLTPFIVPTGGDATGPILSFIPAQIETLPSTVSAGTGILLAPQGLAIDGGDNLYIADTGNNLIRYQDSGGTMQTLAGGGTASLAGVTSGPGTSFKLNQPYDLATDTFGDVLFTDSGDQLVVYVNLFGLTERAVGGGTAPLLSSPCTQEAPCSGDSYSIPAPVGIAIDPSLNIFLGLERITTGGLPAGFFLYEQEDGGLFPLGSDLADASLNFPIAVDANDNLYYAWEYVSGLTTGVGNNCYIIGQNSALSLGSPTGEQTWVVAGTRNCGFSGDGGLATGAQISNSVQGFAFDSAGNFYFTDTGNNRIRRIDALTGIIHTVAGNGSTGYTGDGGPATSANLWAPTGIAVDSQGNVYTTAIEQVTSGTNAREDKSEPAILHLPQAIGLVRKIGANGALSFPAQLTGSHSPAQTILLSNTGNDGLTFTHEAFTSGNTSDFAIDPNSTSCDFTSLLYPGQSCLIGIIFTPGAVGTRSAVLTLLDSSASGSNTILLSGMGATAAAPALSPTSLTFPTTISGSHSALQTITLANHGGLPLTITSIGFVGGSFSAVTTCGASLAAGASCTFGIGFSPTAAGPFAATFQVVTSAGTVSAAVSGSGALPATPVFSPTTLTFPSTTVGSASAAQVLKLSNIGGLGFNVGGFAFGGANSTDFSETNNCTASLAPGASCSVSVTFKPLAAGSPTATLSNLTTAGTVTATLTGTSVAAKPAVTLASKTNPAISGQSVALNAQVAPANKASGPAPTGKVVLKEGQTVLAIASLAAGAASFNLTKLAPGTHELTAYYLGDSSHAASQSPTFKQVVNAPATVARHAQLVSQ